MAPAPPTPVTAAHAARATASHRCTVRGRAATGTRTTNDLCSTGIGHCTHSNIAHASIDRQRHRSPVLAASRPVPIRSHVEHRTAPRHILTPVRADDTLLSLCTARKQHSTPGRSTPQVYSTPNSHRQHRSVSSSPEAHCLPIPSLTPARRHHKHRPQKRATLGHNLLYVAIPRNVGASPLASSPTRGRRCHRSPLSAHVIEAISWSW